MYRIMVVKSRRDNNKSLYQHWVLLLNLIH